MTRPWSVALSRFARHGINPAYGGVPLTEAQAAADRAAQRIDFLEGENERIREALAKDELRWNGLTVRVGIRLEKHANGMAQVPWSHVADALDTEAHQARHSLQQNNDEKA